MDIEAVWWRRVTANDYFNIEKRVISGPRAQLHIDVPNPNTLLKFLGQPIVDDPADWQPITITAAVVWDATVSSQLTFRPRPRNKRYDIRLQNHYSDGSERHPAWTANFGWPTLNKPPTSTTESTAVATTGLTIYLLRTRDGAFLAGYTRGTRLPIGWPTSLTPLFSDRKTAGVIEFDPVELEELAPFTAPIEPQTPHERIDVIEPFAVTQSTIPGSPLRSGGQGYGLNAAERRAVERLAMDKALAHFRAEGFEDIRDVGSKKSYDIEMVKEGTTYIVEVKGTTSGGTSIFLTKNEVRVHRAHYPNNFLYLVSNIKLVRSEAPVAVHGDESIIQGWDIADEALTPVTYSYTV